MANYSKGAQKKVERSMHEMKRGKLKSGRSGKTVKKEIAVRNGLKQEDAKKIVKLIKDAGLKVQAQIMDDTVRVTGKKIDDLQEVIQLCKTSNLGLPMQYINMRN